MIIFTQSTKSAFNFNKHVIYLSPFEYLVSRMSRVTDIK